MRKLETVPSKGGVVHGNAQGFPCLLGRTEPREDTQSDNAL